MQPHKTQQNHIISTQGTPWLADGNNYPVRESLQVSFVFSSSI